MEQEPNQERKLTNTCSNCEQEFVLGEDNSKMTIFLDIPECTYLFSRCTHCNSEERLFIAPNGNTAEQCAEFGIPIDIEDNAPKHLIDNYEELTGERPQPYVELEPIELTPRQERLAEFVAYLLLHERLAIEEFRDTQGDLYI